MRPSPTPKVSRVTLDGERCKVGLDPLSSGTRQMTKLTSLLNAAAARCEPPNDSALAHAIGVSKSAVSLWRKGGKVSTQHLARLIERAQADPSIAAEVLAEMAEERPERTVWTTVARRLGAAAAVAVVVVALPALTGDADSLAATLTAAPFMHYAKWIIAATVTGLAVWSMRGRSPASLLA